GSSEAAGEIVPGGDDHAVAVGGETARRPDGGAREACRPGDDGRWILRVDRDDPAVVREQVAVRPSKADVDDSVDQGQRRTLSLGRGGEGAVQSVVRGLDGTVELC